MKAKSLLKWARSVMVNAVGSNPMDLGSNPSASASEGEMV